MTEPGDSLTIITCPADDPDGFAALDRDQRRRDGGGWKRLPFRSGVHLDTFVMKATHRDFGVFAADDESDADGVTITTCMIDRASIVDVVAALEGMIEIAPARTAHLLFEHGGATGDLGRIAAALRTGDWPAGADPAEEAAAFAHQLLVYGRYAIASLMGVSWEYRGAVRALLTPPPTEARRALETRYAQLVAEPRPAAQAAFAALAAVTRAEAPAEFDAWAFAHYCFLSQVIHEAVERGEADSEAVADARRARAAWAEVRAGRRAFVEDGFAGASTDTHFYAAYFGIEPPA